MRKAPNRAVDALAERVDRDDLIDADVPATVVCARCGQADCAGCLHDESRSGVVAVVPWERPGAPVLARLWATARASTFDADVFFAAMPDGPLAPALRFAVLSEMIAASAMALLALVPIAILAPGWVRHLLVDESATALRVALVGVPLVAALLVVAHAAHGWALDIGARRSGARPATTRSLRFGLYATGWDLVIGPLGAVVVAVREGAASAGSIASLAVGLPGRSALAFLRGCYRLEGEAALPALRASYVAAAVATLIGAAGVMAAVMAAIFS
jgi:hypothetical protein